MISWTHRWPAEHKIFSWAQIGDQLTRWRNVSWASDQFWLSASLFNNNMGGSREDGESGDDGEQGECD